MSYPGGKAGAGVYQRIICEMPPHDVYIEAFAGGGAILRLKRPAAASIAIDADASACAALRAQAPPGCTVVCTDATRWLREHQWRPGTLVYLDPPYLSSTLSRPGRAYYRCAFSTPEQHANLLDVITSLPAMVAISGYWSELYADRLSGWRLVRFMAQTRGGPREECLWMNYPEPAELHDYRYLGEGYRERERMKRMQGRWAARLGAMPRLERYALLSAMAVHGEECRQAPAGAAIAPGEVRSPSPLAGDGDAVRIAGRGDAS